MYMLLALYMSTGADAISDITNCAITDGVWLIWVLKRSYNYSRNNCHSCFQTYGAVQYNWGWAGAFIAAFIRYMGTADGFSSLPFVLEFFCTLCYYEESIKAITKAVKFRALTFAAKWHHHNDHWKWYFQAGWSYKRTWAMIFVDTLPQPWLRLAFISTLLSPSPPYRPLYR